MERIRGGNGGVPESSKNRRSEAQYPISQKISSSSRVEGDSPSGNLVKKFELFKRRQREVIGAQTEYLDAVKDAAARKKAFKLKHEEQKELLEGIKNDLKGIRREIGKDEFGSLKQRIGDHTRQLKYVGESLPSVNYSLFLFIFLGRINIFFPDISHRMAYKRSYNNFNAYFSLINIALVLWEFFYGNYCGKFLGPLGYLPHITWLFYYVALTVREHVLKLNGSNINAWWIAHHYLTILFTVLLMMWRVNSESYSYFHSYFRVFLLYTASVQFFQYRYQKKKMYSLIATEAAGIMDVVNPDSAQIRAISKNLTLLLPFVIVSQILQLILGFKLFEYVFARNSWNVFIEEWEIIIAAVILTILGVGNLKTTIYSVSAKYLHTVRKSANSVINVIEGQLESGNGTENGHESETG